MGYENRHATQEGKSSACSGFGFVASEREKTFWRKPQLKALGSRGPEIGFEGSWGVLVLVKIWREPQAAR